MANSTRFLIELPDNGADSDQWGTLLNNAFSSLEQKVTDRTAGDTINGALTVTGALSGNTVSGNGANLTNLTAGNITPNGTFPVLSGANLINLNASNLASGTVPSARLVNAIDTAAIQNGAVTAEKIASGVIQSPQSRVFTSSGTFTIPAGVTRLKVTVVGGGGNGAVGGTGATAVGGGGGGGGGTAIKWLSNLTPGNTLAVTVSTGSQVSSRVSSGTQTIAEIVGGGGQIALSGGVPGIGGTSSGGDINMKGQDGGTGANINGNGFGIGGNGGSSHFGGGGRGAVTTNVSGEFGGNYGGGGGGGATNGSASSSGGLGGPGIVVFEW